jgi:hypothetical protein
VSKVALVVRYSETDTTAVYIFEGEKSPAWGRARAYGDRLAKSWEEDDPFGGFEYDIVEAIEVTEV